MGAKRVSDFLVAHKIREDGFEILDTPRSCVTTTGTKEPFLQNPKEETRNGLIAFAAHARSEVFCFWIIISHTSYLYCVSPDEKADDCTADLMKHTR